MQAILLRREVPSGSISQLIQILEWEGRIQPGQIKRSMLQEKLTAQGYSTRHMRMYAESDVAARRFQQRVSIIGELSLYLDELVIGLTPNLLPLVWWLLPKNGSNQFYPAEYPTFDEAFEPARLLSAHALLEVSCVGECHHPPIASYQRTVA